MSDTQTNNVVPFSKEQYTFLQKCAETKNIEEWNKWREDNPLIKIELAGADLSNAYLENIHLVGANLQNALLRNCNLKNAVLWETNLAGADLENTNLENADLWLSILENANFNNTNLKNATLLYTNLRNAQFVSANLENTDAQKSYMDTSTLFDRVHINTNTNFGDVNLESIRIDSSTRQWLNYNIRRKKWEEWYESHGILQLPVRIFWWISNYGMSTKRIFSVFTVSTIAFGLLYYFSGFSLPNSNTAMHPHGEPADNNAQKGLAFLLSLYMSFMNMISFGFDTVSLSGRGVFQTAVVVIQKLWNYMLFCTFTARLAVLFTYNTQSVKYVREKRTPSSEKKQS